MTLLTPLTFGEESVRKLAWRHAHEGRPPTPPRHAPEYIVRMYRHEYRRVAKRLAKHPTR